MRNNQGQFIKGSEPWNTGLKGIHLSPESEFKEGLVPWNKGLTGLPGYWTGKKRPPFNQKWKDNMSAGKKGRMLSDRELLHLELLHSPAIRLKAALSMKGRIVTEDTRERLRLANLGKKMSKDARIKMSEAKKGCAPWNKGKSQVATRGQNNPNWRGGSSLNERTSNVDWKRLRKEIYERDNWMCQFCDKHCHDDIQCHHIIPYRLTQDDSKSNLITLCLRCHLTTERYWLARKTIYS